MSDLSAKVIELLSDANAKYELSPESRFIKGETYVKGFVPTLYLTTSLVPNIDGFDAGEVKHGGFYWFNPSRHEVSRLYVRGDGKFEWVTVKDYPMYVFDSDGTLLGHIQHFELNSEIESLRKEVRNVSFSDLLKEIEPD